MSYNRITVPLSIQEEEVLRQAASQSCRRPRDQARYIILKSLGLVTGDIPTLDTDELSKTVANLIDDYTVDKLNRTGELIALDLLEFQQWVNDRYK